jgi:hypothetical protein
MLFLCQKSGFWEVGQETYKSGRSVFEARRASSWAVELPLWDFLMEVNSLGMNILIIHENSG